VRGLLQRVRRAAVAVDGAEVGAIQQGVLLLLGIAHADTVASADTLLDRVLRYRLFPDAQGRMNLSLADSGGGLLIVSQFTLMADTRKGLRPSFTPAAPPEQAERLYDHFIARARVRHAQVACGVFGADMQVELVNDGPVTLLLEV
jgi:D-tyrosyl-tRNA(Tyr) deacylase